MGIRVVPTNALAVDQLDLFASDFYTRLTGVAVADLQLVVFFNNASVSWPLVTGVGITDANIKSGNIYFQEIAGNPGYYGVRFRLNAVGYWRLDFRHPTSVQTLSLDYDAVTAPDVVALGLKASFTGRTCP